MNQLFQHPWRFLCSAVVVASVCPNVRAQDSADVAKVIVPFVEKHCVQCHGEKKPKGDVTLYVFKDDESILKAHTVWLTVVEKVRSGEMPFKGKPQPNKVYRLRSGYQPKLPR